MQFGLDQVIFTPAATPPHKVGKALAPGSARLAMLELATSEDPRWEVSDAEIRRAGTSFTIDTLRALAGVEGGDQAPMLHMILGSDNLPGLPEWWDVEEVLSFAQPIVAWRDGTPDEHLAALDGRLPGHLVERLSEGFMRLPPFPGSATELRRKVAAGQVTAEELPEGILEVIEREGLYEAASPGAKA